MRGDAGLALDSPLCVFDLATQMGIDVWFKATPRMEGMYCKEPGPTIVVTSLRPAGRQAYTGGHEVGHHAFGHGTRVDELIGAGGRGADQEEEFLADCFAGFLLMPKAAVVRGSRPADGTRPPRRPNRSSPSLAGWAWATTP